ncbi:MAG: CotH kinase family protein [Leadbetterella sp.]
MKIWSLLLLLILTSQGCQSSYEGKVTTPRSKNVWVLKITTNSKIKDEPKTNAKLEITIGDSLLAQADIGIEIRGAISQEFDKKSYGFKINDYKNRKTQWDSIGMNTGSKWILLASASDNSFIRNTLSYSLSNQMGKYASRCKYVELEINSKFVGTYILLEKITVAPTKIKLGNNPKEGFVLKIDKLAGDEKDWGNYTEKNSFRSEYDEKGKLSPKSKINYIYHYPSIKKLAESDKKNIQTQIKNFENTIANTQTNDYLNLIDLNSFVDYFILTELMQNHDGYRISTYLTKSSDGKLSMGPIWDCDLAYGPDFAFCEGMQTHNWVYKYNTYCPDDAWLVPFWWEKLVQKPEFKTALKTRFKDLRNNVLSDQNILKTIDDFTKELHSQNLVDRNYERWSEEKKGKTYKDRHTDHINHMKSWIKEHLEWMEKEISKI